MSCNEPISNAVRKAVELITLVLVACSVRDSFNYVCLSCLILVQWDACIWSTLYTGYWSKKHDLYVTHGYSSEMN